MVFKESPTGWIFVMEKGEWVMEQLTKFLTKSNLNSGFIQGIGALENIELGFYNTKINQYLRQSFNETYELLSFSGNISETDGSPFCHAHVVLGNANYETIGGHFFEGRVAVTFEGEIRPLNFPVQRKFNPEIGLNLWDLSVEK